MQRRTLLQRAALAPIFGPLVIAPSLADARRRKAPDPTLPENAPDTAPYRVREDVAAFAVAVAQRHGLDADWTRHGLAHARRLPAVERLIMPAPAGTAKNWAAYRARAIEPVRVRAGLTFWNSNDVWLQRAEERWGVPAQVVVGIIGIETLYGRHMGNFRVLDSLATLSFDFPNGRSDRSSFFRDELESFLLWCHGAGHDPWLPRGSYAGAFGMCQFMPSSVLKYAVDFDDDGVVDLRESHADVIGSVAHYLAAFGWQSGVPARFSVVPPTYPNDRAVLLAPDITPTFTAQEFVNRGASVSDELRAHPGKLALVELHNGDADPSYVAGTENFYAITRYNWSSYYALAVVELGETVARERARGSY